MLHPFFKVSPLKRILSYIVPVTVAYSHGTENTFLEFILYRNQWQLATEDALYSDGNRYEPFRLAFKHIEKQHLATLSSCLILGTGLGSIAQILCSRYGYKGHFSLVEIDRTILDWATDQLTTQGIVNISAHCCNAAGFVKEDVKQYDLVCIDIFQGREVPEVFTELEFLRNARQRLAEGGIWIMNYIINDEKELAAYMRNIRSVFSVVDVVEKGENRILICR
ncbi:spermidine synthase [Taibaiella chishuiensis]|uniref:Methyltransferase family protein n=1 Tax=Taibaiella chishuiensis TaxID=1434707 RepID=A0A2P8D5U6_9BACT|nr:fused MFS/spermidine synthase [Taibaiella chishuiensis]PSK92587.1 methyltransferase family protein [Taibaiella chishuiensis]